MPLTIQDIKLTVRNLLRAEWANDGVPHHIDDEEIHTGWYDEALGFPQVTVSNNEGGPINGGDTGFSAIAGDGSGGIQTRSGLVLVTCWGGSRNSYDARGEAQLQAQRMANVVEAVVGRNQSPGELRSLAVGERAELVDTDSTPVEYAVQFALRYTWQKTPP